MSYPSKPSIVLTLIAALPLVLSGQASAEPGVNLAGTYRCEPQPSPCPWPGQTMSIVQSGSTLDLKNGEALIAQAKVTSDLTVSGGPPWNAIGIIMPDRSIQWSNGTQWRKQ